MAALPNQLDAQAFAAMRRWQQTNKIKTYYPDHGPYRRELYVKHMEYFAGGAQHRERAFIAANRVGKTEGVSAYELALHLTGDYPGWWKGKRFEKGISAWAAGDTNQTTRDILQAKLLGKIARTKGDDPSKPMGLGTGMIPAVAIKMVKPKPAPPNSIETAWIAHVSGGISTLTFKSFEQGRKSFQGTEIDVICLDEEPPQDVYQECLVRTMKTGAFAGGLMILTFTPLEGWTEVISEYLDEEKRLQANRFFVQAGWDDAPHISTEEKADMLRRFPEYQRDARTKGIPQLGSGAIYQIPESEIAEEPLGTIPAHWPRAYGLDPGWNRTAAVWGAYDRDSGIIHLYAEHYFSHMDVGQNARAIRERGAWIPGVIDPAARGRSQIDGAQLIENYREAGLDLEIAISAREAGIQVVRDWMLDGRLKVSKALSNWWKEYRLYRRDEKGQVVKQNDHILDATRYLMVSGRDRMKIRPVARPAETVLRQVGPGYRGEQGWME